MKRPTGMSRRAAILAAWVGIGTLAPPLQAHGAASAITNPALLSALTTAQ